MNKKKRILRLILLFGLTGVIILIGDIYVFKVWSPLLIIIHETPVVAFLIKFVYDELHSKK